MSGSLITDEIRALIGLESEPERNRFPISAEMAYDVADAIEDYNPLYVDPEYAERQPVRRPALSTAGGLERHRPAHWVFRRRAGVAFRGSAALQQLRTQRGQRLAISGSGAGGELGYPAVSHLGHF